MGRHKVGHLADKSTSPSELRRCMAEASYRALSTDFERARYLRDLGLSFSIIAKALERGKSTIARWCSMHESDGCGKGKQLLSEQEDQELVRKVRTLAEGHTPLTAKKLRTLVSNFYCFRP